MNYNRITKFLFAFIGSIGLISYFVLKTIKNTIGTLEINQLIWSLKLNNEGVDLSVVFLYIGCCALAIFFSFIYCLLVYRYHQIYKFFYGNYLKKIPIYNIFTFKLKKFQGVFTFILLAILTNFTYHTLLRVNDSANIIFYLKNNLNKSYPDYDFVKENYFVPKNNEITFKQKKNIVIVLVESFENTYFDHNNPYHINSKINLDQAISFNNFKECSSINFTIAALTAWHFGLPLNLPLKDYNDYVGIKFLPKAFSVFEVLKANGYNNNFLLGTDKAYSGKKNLFGQHGNFTIKDKNYWIENGYSLEKFQGSGWGFSDSFTLERGIEEYKELLKQKHPFSLIVETVDLHFPNGWSPVEFYKYNDLRDPVAYVDDRVANFVNQFKKINDPNTILIVLGDHYYMGVSKILDKKVSRSIFNAIYTSQEPINFNNLKKSVELVSALDIAPTILELCGASWSCKQFGLGVSLLSTEKSLIEKYGEQKFNELIKQKSKFYDQLF